MLPVKDKPLTVAKPIPDAPAEIIIFLFFNDLLTINYDFVNDVCNSLLDI